MSKVIVSVVTARVDFPAGAPAVVTLEVPDAAAKPAVAAA